MTRPNSGPVYTTTSQIVMPPPPRADINAMQAPYIVFPITHPTQALFWVVPATGVYLISAAIDELKAAAAIMTS